MWNQGGFEGDFSVAVGNGNIGVDSKVGVSFALPQAQKYAEAVAYGRSLLSVPGVTRIGGGLIDEAHCYFFENPVTGVMPLPWNLAALTRLGIGYTVYFVGYY